MNMRRGIQTALSAIYPPRCVGCSDLVESDFGLCGSCWRDTPFIGGTVCDTCGLPLPGEAAPGEDVQCDDCLKRPPPWRQGRAALMYKGRARQLVLAFKHGDRHDVFRPAAHWLRRVATPMISDPRTLVVPVPLHWMRLVKRRYNQSALLAQAFARETGLTMCPDVLQRIRRTVSLDGKTQAERNDIMETALTVHPRRRHLLVDRSVLILDDVMTSGATLSAATRACLDAGANHVNVLVLARVGKDT